MPAILDRPGRAGGVVAAPASFLDVVPTVLAAAGVPAPPGLAVHVSTLAWTQFRFQSMVKGFDYLT